MSRRTLLAVGVGVVNIAVTGVLVSAAYRASQESLTRQAVATARIVATAREEALARMLSSQRGRIAAFAGSIQSLCGERMPARRGVAFEMECVHVALRGFRASERALGVELRSGTRRVASTGRWPQNPKFSSGNALASVFRDGTTQMYGVDASLGTVRVAVVYPASEFADLVLDRSGLKGRGTIALFDAEGGLSVPAGGAVAPLKNPIAAATLTQCLAGESGEVLLHAPAGAELIAGFEPVPALGGGCVVARLDYQEAIGPIRRLGNLFLLGSSISIILAMIVSIDLVRREYRARIAAEDANRMKDDFLATLSHELRTPLTAILGWVSLLRRQPYDPERLDHALDVIERSAEAEARLIEDLLDVTRIVNGQLRLHVAEISPVNAVDAAVDSVRPTAEAKGVVLMQHVDGAVPTIMGDSHRLQQVVWNLLANAVRFTPRGGLVDVTLRQVGDSVELSVMDSGIGIAPELLPHIFERFRKGQAGTQYEYSGLGLGLAIVRHIVELHGGTVRADSEGIDCGTTMTVLLPTAAAHAGDQKRAGADAGEHTLVGARIVVVDDDRDSREVVREILELAGASVTTSESADETRALVHQLHPDVLIADIGMPGEDGYSLMRSLRATDDAADTKAIALTAHARPEDVERAIESGFQSHVAKPVDSSRLVTAVAALIRRAA